MTTMTKNSLINKCVTTYIDTIIYIIKSHSYHKKSISFFVFVGSPAPIKNKTNPN